MGTMNKGFTLIELVVVAGLIGVLSVGIVSVFIATITGNRKAKLYAEVKEQGDYAIASMERTIRNSNITPTCAGTTLTFSQPEGDGYRKGYTYQIINGDNGTIQKYDPVLNQTNKIISDKTAITDGSFTCMPDSTDFTQGRVRIQFTATTTNDIDQKMAQVFETTVAIRTVK